jgi:hypothetical protein
MATKLNQTTDEGAKDTGNGIKLLGEVIVPGASQFIDGNIRSGGLHLLGAVASVALLGGPGGLLLSALVRGNSFTTSTLHKPIYKALIERAPSDAAAEPATGRGGLATT